GGSARRSRAAPATTARSIQAATTLRPPELLHESELSSPARSDRRAGALDHEDAERAHGARSARRGRHAAPRWLAFVPREPRARGPSLAHARRPLLRRRTI